MHEPQVAHFSIPRNPDSANADAFSFFCRPDGAFFFTLADGVGKSEYGPAAAQSSVAVAKSFAFDVKVFDIFEAARTSLVAAASKTPGHVWSTTLTFCRVQNGIAEVGHVGDARLYHLRGAGIITRTKDQTEVQALIDEGVLSKERAKKYPRRNVLLSAISSDSTFELSTSKFEIQEKDRLLLVSDGIYKQIQRKEIAGISATAKTPSDFLSALSELLQSRGIHDDSTAVCVEFN